jgi:hypothetical protein
MTLISNIFIYPDNLKDFRLDCRSPFGKPFMLVSFDYIQEPETDERIIRDIEDRFNDVTFEDMEIKPVSIRKYITTRHVETTIFKPSYSLS